MKIRVLSFASASDAIGRDEVSFEIDDDTTVDGLRLALSHKYPALEGLWERLAIAVNGEIASGDSPLSEGAEVALLPPVSGGSGPAGVSTSNRSCEVRAADRPAPLTDQAIDLDQARRAIENPRSGAVLVFVGYVREQHQGRAVDRITYSAYRAMAERRLRTIERELEAAAPGLMVCLVHRLGTLEVGEASVVIAVSSAHREDSYKANRLALERIKAEVPIWKREHYRDGGVAWREEEPLDSEGGAALLSPPAESSSGS